MTLNVHKEEKYQKENKHCVISEFSKNLLHH